MSDNVDHSFKSPAVLSICTGLRGLEIGVERAIRALRHMFGLQSKTEDERALLKPAAYVEIESVAVYNLVAQMEQGVLAPVPVWTDLKTFPWRLFRNKIFMLIGGYPCQPFSLAGKQHGVRDPRHLFPYIEHGIGTIGPICCFFENVSNHLNIGYREVRYSLESLGYTVEEGIFSAEEVGAPHLRKRLFILAVANTYCTEQSKKRGDFAKMFGLQKIQREPEHSAALLSGSCEELGDTNGSRNETWLSEASSGQKRDSKISHHPSEGVAHETLERTSYGLWPAGQGESQHPWEHPRLESRLGFTVNGYDFTEDLLRMAGNAVVEQTAEVAFITLLKKHRFI